MYKTSLYTLVNGDMQSATIFLASSSLPLRFFVHLLFSDTSIPSRTTLLELRRFHTTSL